MIPAALNPDAYMFDIDGTLLVTKDLVHWNGLRQAMLQTYGIDTTIEGLPYHGKTDIAILRMAMERCGISGAAFKDKLQAALSLICSEVSANSTAIRPEVCPCIRDVLQQFRSQGKVLGVASGNLEIVGWHKISAAGLRESFSFGCFGDECELRSEIFARAVAEVKRRLGEQASVCFIGDTPEDIRAARKVNAKIIAVSTGIYHFEELSALQPDACYNSCADLRTHAREGT
jgi:phosphoglycolate phosphatase